MGTGVGEAMLISAAVGAGTGAVGSSISGGNPLKGALRGAILGGVTGGVGSAIGGAANAGVSAAEIAGGAGMDIASTAGQAGFTGMGVAEQAGLQALNPAAIATPTPMPNFDPTASYSAPTPASKGMFDFGYKGPTPNVFEYGPQSNLALGGVGIGAGLDSAMAAERAKYGMPPNQASYDGPLKRFIYDPSTYSPDIVRPPNPRYSPRYAAEGGIMSLLPKRMAGGGITALQNGGGPVERMSMMNTAMSPQSGMYPQGMIDKTQYAVPTQRPNSMEVLDSGAQTMFAPGGRVAGQDMAAIDAYVNAAQSGELNSVMAKARGGDYNAMLALNRINKTPNQNYAEGGISDLGSYSDGGRMLKGPGDGMSDNIPAMIGKKQPARLADGEFVVPADVVSHLGNGSTDAGAKQLYAMMDNIRKARTGKKKQAPAVKANRFVPV